VRVSGRTSSVVPAHVTETTPRNVRRPRELAGTRGRGRGWGRACASGACRRRGTQSMASGMERRVLAEAGRKRGDQAGRAAPRSSTHGSSCEKMRRK
jgi:hypothetical protein